MIAGKSLPLRRSIQPALHQGHFDPSIFTLSSIASANYELFAHFCNVDPLFSSLYELFAQKHPGRGVGHKNATTKRCAQKDENII
jgi:hypothetical protein